MATTELAVVEPGPLAEVQEHQPVRTLPMARDEYVAKALSDAYSRASMLVLSKEESDALTADFDDDAIDKGAGGKEGLLYISHAHVEDRLNRVLGVGQWVFIPRSTRHEHTKEDKYGNPIYTVFIDGVLLVRGCYVGEDFASMDYIPSNASMSYDDAYSGAQSNAIRRIAAKRLGVGLQCWKKSWCADWKKRQRGESSPAAADGLTAAERRAAAAAKQAGANGNGHAATTPATTCPPELIDKIKGLVLQAFTSGQEYASTLLAAVGVKSTADLDEPKANRVLSELQRIIADKKLAASNTATAEGVAANQRTAGEAKDGNKATEGQPAVTSEQVDTIRSLVKQAFPGATSGQDYKATILDPRGIASTKAATFDQGVEIIAALQLMVKKLQPATAEQVATAPADRFADLDSLSLPDAKSFPDCACGQDQRDRIKALAEAKGWDREQQVAWLKARGVDSFRSLTAKQADSLADALAAVAI